MQFDFMYAFTVSFYFSQVDQVVDPAFSLSRKPHPTGTAKERRGAARDIFVVALTGHNTHSAHCNFVHLV